MTGLNVMTAVGRSLILKKNDMKNPFSKTFNASELESFQFLSQIRFFSQLKNAEMARFLPAIHERIYRKDEVVFFRGDPSQALYLLKRGNIRLTIDIRDSFETISDLQLGNSANLC